jgi:hypothetical protein
MAPADRSADVGPTGAVGAVLEKEAVNPQPSLFADVQGAGLVPKLETITGEALERWR